MLLDSPAAAAYSRTDFEATPSGVWRYRGFLPDVPPESIVSLGEGGTPLLQAQRLGAELGVRSLMLKDESRNPTGSFMDRGTTLLLSMAAARGVKECRCVTTGNLGASLAAYCAKAGIAARIQINPNTDQGKLYQMLAYGAEVETESHERVDSRTLEVTAANPYLLQGEKTTGFEVVQDLGWKMPEVIVVPVGTGGHLSMIWRSLIELRAAGLVESSACRLLGVRLEEPTRPEAAGGRTTPVQRFQLAELTESEPFFLMEADRAIIESRGLSLKTTPGETVSATSILAKTEGIFAEPSSASVVAALANAVRDGHVDRSETVVCVITGAGLKDTKTVSRLAREARRVALREPFAMPSPQIGGTKFALLRLLHEKPSYGYELRRNLGPERKMSTASVYQHLADLEAIGMARRRGAVLVRGRERIIYELTKKGSDYLRIAGKLRR